MMVVDLDPQLVHNLGHDGPLEPICIQGGGARGTEMLASCLSLDSSTENVLPLISVQSERLSQNKSSALKSVWIHFE